MTAAKCIRSKAKAGKVNKDKAIRAAELFDEYMADLEHRNAPNAEELAATQTSIALAAEKRMKKKIRLAAMKTQADMRARMTDFKLGARDPREAALAHLDQDFTREAQGLNVFFQTEVWQNQFWARASRALDEFGSKRFGLDVLSPAENQRKKALSTAIARELHGEATGDAVAKEVAASIQDGTEFLRQTFNSFGGSIARRKDWGMTHTHDGLRIREVPKDEWTEFVFNRLDREQMVDEFTSLPYTETKLRRVLGEIYDDITSFGIGDVQPQGGTGSNIVSRRAQARFLTFRNSDAWLEYNERFGKGDVFENIMSHAHKMARDIALLQVLGPNPDVGHKYLKRLMNAEMTKRSAQELAPRVSKLIDPTGHFRKAIGKARRNSLNRGESALNHLYAEVNGQAHIAENETLAAFSQMNRNVLTSAMLGGSVFSAVADRAFTRVTANINGVPASRTAMRAIALMNPGNKADRQLAARAGFINDQALGAAIAAQRYAGEVIGPEWSRRVADISLRLGGLAPWTTWNRTAFQMEHLGWITDNMKSPWAKLDDRLKRGMEANGIREGDWEIIRNTKVFQDQATGARILNPRDIVGELTDAGPLFDRHRDAAAKLLQYVLSESRTAVPEPTARTRAALRFGLRPGTVIGEVVNNVALFKSFPVTLIQMHMRRAFLMKMSNWDRAKYFAQMIIGTTILGTFGQAMSDISRGKDPAPLAGENAAKNWGQGLLRGGGLGIFGDFIFSSENRFGGGVMNTLAGPVLGTQLSLVKGATIDNVMERIFEGEAKNVGRETLRAVKLMMPGRSLWYSTLAMERLIFDQIQKEIDPNYTESFRAIQRRALKEHDQLFFSPPGSGFPPPRGPDLERLIEG